MFGLCNYLPSLVMKSPLVSLVRHKLRWTVPGQGQLLLPLKVDRTRNHFPRPREVKRIHVHGWATRMSTPEGRRVLMRRILKGRHVLSH